MPLVVSITPPTDTALESRVAMYLNVDGGLHLTPREVREKLAFDYNFDMSSRRIQIKQWIARYVDDLNNRVCADSHRNGSLVSKAARLDGSFRTVPAHPRPKVRRLKLSPALEAFCLEMDPIADIAYITYRQVCPLVEMYIRRNCSTVKLRRRTRYCIDGKLRAILPNYVSTSIPIQKVPSALARGHQYTYESYTE